MTKICECKDLLYPHELGVDGCHNTSTEPPFCGECGHHDDGQWLDFGIGSYEFWGAKYVDTDRQFVSTCCEAPLYEDQNAKVLYEPPTKDDDCADDDYAHYVETNHIFDEEDELP